MRLCLIFAAVLLLSACQLALPGKTPDVAAVNPITTGQISVTSLDSPALMVATDPAPSPATPVAEPVADPAPDPVTDPAATPALPPQATKSPAQIACEKRKGRWVNAGTTGAMFCQTPLPDAGKACARDRDCEGQCLARSRTCAPSSPMFGCNEVLQDNGQRVTLCID